VIEDAVASANDVRADPRVDDVVPGEIGRGVE